MPYTKFTYLTVDQAELFTMVCLPEKEGAYPAVIWRTPYVDPTVHEPEEAILARLPEEFREWTESGYAVILQHCRGCGKSSGDCIPYINEREDGLALQQWVREQSFYNGEIYLCGGSYLSSVHFVTAPFAEDIKGAVLEVQDCERYNCNYRNGFYKMGLHGGWYTNMYKKKSGLYKTFVPEAYHTLPLIDFSKNVFGESAEDFDQILLHPDKNDPFWQTRFGGGEAHDAIKHADIPILLVTGFYDIYTGGVFDMWNGLDEATKHKCALAVHPYAHSGKSEGQPIFFPDGELKEKHGDYRIQWLNHIRGKGTAPFAPGKITYYRLFENKWGTDTFEESKNTLKLPLGNGEKTYRYNPYAPASFKGGCSSNFDGTAYQDPPNSRYDILSFYSEPFAEEQFVKGKIRAKLRVRTTGEDTCFYIRLSITKPDGDYALRDDIHAVSEFAPDYIPGTEVDMEFACDEHAFLIQKGERIRIDVSSSCFPYYVRHTNRKGPFALQTTAVSVENTVLCDKSHILLPLEK